MSAIQTSAADVPELQAIVFTSHVLKTFSDNDARLRVMRGVAKYFGLQIAIGAPGAQPQSVEGALDVPAFEELVASAAANSRRFTPAVAR